MSDERKAHSPRLGLAPPVSGSSNSSRLSGAFSSSSSAASSIDTRHGDSTPRLGHHTHTHAHDHRPHSLPPLVSHSTALSQLASMFPHLPHDIILFELNQNDRELERTITALLCHSQGADASSHAQAAAFQAQESDAAMAQRMQEEMDEQYARNLVASTQRVSGGGGGGHNHLYGDGMGSGAGAAAASKISEEELDRLRLAQFAHREAIYQTNAEGPFAAKVPATLMPASSSSSSADGALSLDHDRGGGGKHGKKSKGASKELTPMERIARDRKLFQTTAHNRVADEEEMQAAKDGPKAMAALRAKRAEAEKALASLQAMGFDVRAAQNMDPKALAAMERNRANLAAMQAEAAFTRSPATPRKGASGASSSSSAAAVASASSALSPATPLRPLPSIAPHSGGGSSSARGTPASADRDREPEKEERRRARRERERAEGQQRLDPLSPSQSQVEGRQRGEGYSAASSAASAAASSSASASAASASSSSAASAAFAASAGETERERALRLEVEQLRAALQRSKLDEQGAHSHKKKKKKDKDKERHADEGGGGSSKKKKKKREKDRDRAAASASSSSAPPAAVAPSAASGRIAPSGSSSSRVGQADLLDMLPEPEYSVTCSSSLLEHEQLKPRFK